MSLLRPLATSYDRGSIKVWLLDCFVRDAIYLLSEEHYAVPGSVATAPQHRGPRPRSWIPKQNTRITTKETSIWQMGDFHLPRKCAPLKADVHTRKLSPIIKCIWKLIAPWLLFINLNVVHDRSSLARSSTTLTTVRAASLPTVVESLEMEDMTETREAGARRRNRSCSGVKCQVWTVSKHFDHYKVCRQ